MISVYQRKEDCCGCTACMHVCPAVAITMVPDEEGFHYPLIDQGLCIDCNKCVKVCPLVGNRRRPSDHDIPIVYAAKHKDDKVRFTSSSGGMYTAISDHILDLGGIVYGVGFDENFVVCHQSAETPGERDKFKGSKYVQSDLGKVFVEIKERLFSERIVLFTGTPCQNAGLRSYLGKDYENLYLCDIVCHGTPSPLVWRNYLDFCERKRKSTMKEYYFRFKGNGWGHTERAVYTNGLEDSSSALSQSYRSLFYSRVALRPACHECEFCDFSRPSDITIADFWGVKRSMPDFCDDLGVSLVLINSVKGKELFNKIRVDLHYRKSSSAECLQRNLYQPTPPSLHRDQFWHDFRQRDFGYVLKKYGGTGVCVRLRKSVVRYLTKLGLIDIVRRATKGLRGASVE